MEFERNIIVTSIAWQGMLIEVSYEPDWLSMGTRHQFATAHLQLRSLQPEKAPLPITETGYRSHFLPCGVVEEFGGAESYARQWLDEAAKESGWRQHVEATQQLSLF